MVSSVNIFISIFVIYPLGKTHSSRPDAIYGSTYRFILIQLIGIGLHNSVTVNYDFSWFGIYSTNSENTKLLELNTRNRH